MSESCRVEKKGALFFLTFISLVIFDTTKNKLTS